MTQYPTDESIDQTFPDNDAGDIGADDMRAFQKSITAAGRDPTAVDGGVAISVHSDQVSYVKDQLVGYEGGVYFAINDHTAQPFSLANFHAIGASSGSGVTMRYEWTTSTSGQAPTGQFGVTGNVADASNTVRVSIETATGLDLGLFWANVNTGDYILFVEDTGGAESVLFIVTGAPVLQSGGPNWYEIPVDMVTVDGESENNRNALVSIITNPESKMPTGGTTGQVLTKLSDANYDVGWTTP